MIKWKPEASRCRGSSEKRIDYGQEDRNKYGLLLEGTWEEEQDQWKIIGQREGDNILCITGLHNMYS